MNLTVLTDEELFKLAENQYAFNEHINSEWYKRHRMYFPYKLVDENVYNCILKVKMSDAQCDKLIAQQAKAARELKIKPQ